MNFLNKSINVILLFILFVIIVFSSISFYSYLSLLEQKNYLKEKLQFYEEKKKSYERIINQLQNKKDVENLRIFLLKKKENEKFVYFYNKVNYPKYKTFKNKNLYVLIYILFASFFYLLILQDFIKNFEKNDDLYKYNFKYFKGAKGKNYY